MTSVLPNPDLFVAMYVRHEAVLSSQIEGTQSTLEDVLQFEIDAAGQAVPKDVEEVVNYVRAMNHGLERLDELPFSLRLIREIHGVLLEDVRGSHRTPGDVGNQDMLVRRVRAVAINSQPFPNVRRRQAQTECIIYGLACNTKLGPEPCIRVKLFGLPPAISNCTKNPSGAPSRPKRLAATGTSV